MGFNLGNVLNNNKNKKSSNPFGGIILGIILLIAGTVLLWWNEGNNVKNIQAVKEVTKSVVDVDSASVNSENEEKVVCLSGDLKLADEQVVDTAFPVGTKTAKLSRAVEVYQWVEEEHTDSNDNSKTYTYKQEWSSSLVDSSNFHDAGHNNNTTMPYDDETFCTSDATIGAFHLSQEQIKGLSTNKDLSLDSSMTLPEGYTVSGKYITNAANIDSPNVGDIRISYYYNGYTQATVLAVQKGSSFINFVSASGKTINRVEEGTMGSSEVIKKMTDENNSFKWIMRLLGIGAIILGWLAMFSLVTNLASHIPFLGGLVGGAVGLIAFALGLAQSLIVIAIAWIRFRPVLGIALLAIAAALIVFLKKYAGKNKQTAE